MLTLLNPRDRALSPDLLRRLADQHERLGRDHREAADTARADGHHAAARRLRRSSAYWMTEATEGRIEADRAETEAQTRREWATLDGECT